MPEYIEREAIIHKLNNLTTEFLEHNTVQGGIAAGVAIGIRDDVVATAPTADVAEVKRGYWCLLDECANEGVYCSACHKKVYKADYANQKLKSPYCPNCGAKMGGGKQ